MANSVNSSSSASGWAGVLFLAVVISLVAWGCSAIAGDEGGSASLAEVMCERDVKEKMKDPGSAKFSGVSSTSAGTDKWTVTGTVRGANSFGGVAVHEFKCEAEYRDGSMWLGSVVY